MKIVKDETFPVFHGYKCDCCGRVDTKDDNVLEVQEYLHYEDVCGYGAVYSEDIPFADGDKISLSLCQYCKIKLLGAFIKVSK